MQILIKKYLTIGLILLSLCVELVGCTNRIAYGDCNHRLTTSECRAKKLVKDVDITATSYTAVDNLMHHFSAWQTPNMRMLVTTIADIDNLADSTSFGRLIGEQISVRLAQIGLTVIEAKFFRGLNFISRTGEFILSRELREWGQIQQANVFIAGTYAVAEDTVYITIKMLNFEDSQILSSYAYELPIGPNTLALLQEDSWF